MNDLTPPEHAPTIARLRSKFFVHTAFRHLEQEFSAQLQRRRAEIELGVFSEARGIAVIGEAGSGKTTAIRRLFCTYHGLQLDCENETKADVISLSVPSPATVKFVGLSCLSALGYPLRRDRTSAMIWELAHNVLTKRRTLFLHFDEAQDLYTNQNEREMQAVVNTLKSLMQNSKWPVGIVLSGMPKLCDLLNLDPQLARRFTPVHFAPLTTQADLRPVAKLMQDYANFVGLLQDDDVKSPSFLRRLIHSSANQFGILIELVIGAIENAMVSGRTRLASLDFVEAFSRRSGCILERNPFLIDDYSSINARLLLVGAMQTPDAASAGRRG